MSFNKISYEDNAMLVGSIYEEEIKEAVWNCDSNKSLGRMVLTLTLLNFVGRTLRVML